MGSKEVLSRRTSARYQNVLPLQFITCGVFPLHWENPEITLLVASHGTYQFNGCQSEFLILLGGLQTFATGEGDDPFSGGVPLSYALGIFTEQS